MIKHRLYMPHSNVEPVPVFSSEQSVWARARVCRRRKERQATSDVTLLLRSGRVGERGGQGCSPGPAEFLRLVFKRNERVNVGRTMGVSNSEGEVGKWPVERNVQMVLHPSIASGTRGEKEHPCSFDACVKGSGVSTRFESDGHPALIDASQQRSSESGAGD